jgi:tetratricopeptide (TPR) repeat protein
MATFLGRDAELGALERALADVSGGRGRLFLLVGEPGIGKTRLADELAARAPKQLRVLWGRCWEAGGAPAYWPWIEVLRPLLAEMDPRALLAELGPAATSLAALIPELGERLPELGKQVDDSDHARFRLFDALARFLRLVAARTPLLLVLDDLHVADRPSLLLLDFVARTLRGTRAMIVGTYRDADARLRPEVDDLLAQIAREGERLELRRLRESEIAELIEGATETAADPRTVAAVVRATEGTPLYVSEVVRLIAAQRHAPAPLGRISIPDGLRPAIRGHLARVSDKTRAVLRVAAVVGREFGADLLRDIAAVDLLSLGAAGREGGETLAPELAEAQRAGLVTELPGDTLRYRFNHILIRETIYQDLGAAERERLHGRVGRALEAKGGTRPEGFAELAHHLLRAPAGTERRKAALYARRAGEHALHGYAHEEATAHFQSALGVLDDVGPAADRERGELLLLLAAAHQRNGQRTPARQASLEAGELARALADPVMLAEAALRMGAEFSFGVVDPQLVALLEEALSGLPTAPSALRARVMARLASARQPAPDPEQPIALAKQAMALARELGDRRTLAAVLRDARSAYLPMDSLQERTVLDLETLALANETGDTLAAVYTERRLAIDCLEAGQIAAALAHLDEYDRLVEERREPHRAWHSKYERASIHTLLGRFDDAERLLREADGSLIHTQDPLARLAKGGHWATFAWTSTRPFDYAALYRNFATARATNQSLDLQFAEMVARCRMGDAAYVRAAWERWPLERIPARFTGSELRAEMARLLGDRASGEVLYRRMQDWTDRFTNSFTGSEGSFSRPLGQLADFLGRADEAGQHFEAAIEHNRRAGALPWVAHTQKAYAEMLGRIGGETNGRRARQLMDEARAIGEALGMPGLIEAIDSLRGGDGRSVPPAATRAGDRLADLIGAFTLEGDYWTIRFEGRELRFKDSKGLQILAHLVRHPGREFHVLQLVAVAGGSDSSEALIEGPAYAGPDASARADYRDRAEDLQDQLAEAEAHSDLGRVARLRAELDALADEIARGHGLGGRERKTGGSAERARINVQRRLADTLRKIEEACPSLGRQLARTLRTGSYCAYEPG